MKTNNTSNIFGRKNKYGFTLVELIVVITILVILGTISFLQLGGFAGSARDSRRVSDMANITQAIELAVVTQGNAPIPTNPVSYTGGSVTLQVGTVTASTVPKMSGDFSDPITKLPYNYSVFGNGLYYQLGIDFENPLSYHTNSVGVDIASSIGIPGIDTVYADNGVKYSKLSGSYKFDPSLPSLFFLSGTVNSASGGIFSPDVCFILNNVSTNTFSSTSTGCVAKKNMALKTLDSSLVGYWDMESYYQTTYSGTNNVVFLKDLSGNGYDMFMATGSSYGNSITTSSGSIFTNSIIGKGVVFDNANYKYGFSTISLGKTFTFSGRVINTVPGNIFAQNYNASGSMLLPGISASMTFDYDKNNAQNWGNKRILSFILNNIDGGVDSGDFLKAIDSSFIRFQGNLLHEFIVPYNDGPITSTGIYGLNGCGNNNSAIDGLDYCQQIFYKTQVNTISGKNIITTNIDFGHKKYCVYLNGMKFTCEDIDQSAINRLQEGGYKVGGFNIGSAQEPFSGIIDDIKIYNRALSDDEVKQQAKTAGF